MIFSGMESFVLVKTKWKSFKKRSSGSVNNETCKIRYFFPNFFFFSLFVLILGMCFCVRFPSSPTYLCERTWRVKKKFGAEEVQHNNNKVDVLPSFVPFFFSVVFLLSHRNNEEFRLRLKATFSFSLRRDEWPTRSIFPAGRMKCRPMDGDRVLA